MALGHERTEAVARRAIERDVDGAVGKPLPAIGFRQLVPSIVPTVRLVLAIVVENLTGGARVEGLPAHHDQLLIQCLVQAVVLPASCSTGPGS